MRVNLTSCTFILLIILFSSTTFAHPAAHNSSFEKIIDAATPAIVHIAASSGTPDNRARQNKHTELPFSPIRNGFSFGSGFLISSNGYLLTSKHVVSGKKYIFITLSNKQSASAKILALDPKQDLALLKIEGSRYSFLPLSHPQKVKIGHWALALSCPMKGSLVATAGIISSLVNPATESIYQAEYIQTDATIFPSSSGGPLLSFAGEIIGIISASLSNVSSQAHLGFALPIESIIKSQIFNSYPDLIKEYEKH